MAALLAEFLPMEPYDERSTRRTEKKVHSMAPCWGSAAATATALAEHLQHVGVGESNWVATENKAKHTKLVEP